MKLIIPGKPVAQARPRFFRRGSFVGAYSAQETEAGKFMLLAREYLRGKNPLEGPISLKAEFYFPVLKSWPKWMKKKAEDGFKFFHVKKPDLSNCLKFVEDCMNGIAWVDDSQIYRVEAVKYYGTEPKTVLIIEEVSE